MSIHTTPGLLFSPVFHVRPEWIDQNGHMGMSKYLEAFEAANPSTLDTLGLGWAYNLQGTGTTYTLQYRLFYWKELLEGDAIQVSLRVLDYDEKRLIYYTEMFHLESGSVAAAAETLVIHVRHATRRSSPFPPDLLAAIRKAHEAQKHLPLPQGIDRPMEIRRKT